VQSTCVYCAAGPGDSASYINQEIEIGIEERESERSVKGFRVQVFEMRIN
jgi:hypothetical protein